MWKLYFKFEIGIGEKKLREKITLRHPGEKKTTGIGEVKKNEGVDGRTGNESENPDSLDQSKRAPLPTQPELIKPVMQFGTLLKTETAKKAGKKAISKYGKVYTFVHATVDEKICSDCGNTFKPTSNVQKRCPDCKAKKMKQPKPGKEVVVVPETKTGENKDVKVPEVVIDDGIKITDYLTPEQKQKAHPGSF
jgi:predicted Zn-ribbon and HTH transcriptional regulator